MKPVISIPKSSFSGPQGELGGGEEMYPRSATSRAGTESAPMSMPAVWFVPPDLDGEGQVARQVGPEAEGPLAGSGVRSAANLSPSKDSPSSDQA